MCLFGSTTNYQLLSYYCRKRDNPKYNGIPQTAKKLKGISAFNIGNEPKRKDQPLVFFLPVLTESFFPGGGGVTNLEMLLACLPGCCTQQLMEIHTNLHVPQKNLTNNHQPIPFQKHPSPPTNKSSVDASLRNPSSC